MGSYARGMLINWSRAWLKSHDIVGASNLLGLGPLQLNKVLRMALKVLSLNVWGIHYVAQKVRERICCIAEELKAYDIVGLQELWSADDYQYLVAELKRNLPYSFHFKSGIIGSGLCVFSHYPIISVNSQQFTATGSLGELKDGEMFAGKGILTCRIMTPTGPLLFATTHTNPRCRESQMYEMTKLLGSCRGNDPVILCGDFNTGVTNPAYGLITTYLGLKDAFAGCTVNTCNLQSNIYTKKGKKPPIPNRIDFIFYSSGLCPTVEMEVQSKRLALSGNIPGRDYPYSDHEGLEVVFGMKQRTIPLAPPSTQLEDNAIAVLEEIAQRIHNRKKKFEAVHPHRRVLIYGVCIFVLLLLIAFIFGNNRVMTYLGTYSLGCFVLLGVGVLGVGCSAAWLVPVFNIHHVNGLESHVNEIHTRINYNRMQAESGTEYHLME